MDIFIEYIATHWWASIVLAVLYIAYEIIIRKLPTNSPYLSIAHIIGKAVKLIGKAVLKVIGENLSKEVEDLTEKEKDDPAPTKRRFKKHK